jgi:hypothetical protein
MNLLDDDRVDLVIALRHTSRVLCVLGAFPVK